MAASEETKYAVKQILVNMTPVPDKYQRRVLAGRAAAAPGHGGSAFVRSVTGRSKDTVRAGMIESVVTPRQWG